MTIFSHTGNVNIANVSMSSSWRLIGNGRRHALTGLLLQEIIRWRGKALIYAFLHWTRVFERLLKGALKLSFTFGTCTSNFHQNNSEKVSPLGLVWVLLVDKMTNQSIRWKREKAPVECTLKRTQSAHFLGELF